MSIFLKQNFRTVLQYYVGNSLQTIPSQNVKGITRKEINKQINEQIVILIILIMIMRMVVILIIYIHTY